MAKKSESIQKLLTVPLSGAVHKRIHETARSHGIPPRAFSKMLLEAGLAAVSSGSLKVSGPSINVATTPAR